MATPPAGFKTGKAIWRNADHDQPIEVIGYLGAFNGEHYVAINDSMSGVPFAEVVYENDLGTVDGRKAWVLSVLGKAECLHDIHYEIKPRFPKAESRMTMRGIAYIVIRLGNGDPEIALPMSARTRFFMLPPSRWGYLKDQTLIDAVDMAWYRFPEWQKIAKVLLERKTQIVWKELKNPLTLGQASGTHLIEINTTQRDVWIGVIAHTIVHESIHTIFRPRRHDEEPALHRIENEITAMEWGAKAWKIWRDECPADKRADAAYPDALVEAMEKGTLTKLLLQHDGYEEFIFGGKLPKK